MSRRILAHATALAAMLTLCVHASAQVGEPMNTFSIGASGGVSMAKVSFAPTVRQHTQRGAVGGVAARYVGEKYFGLSCGVQLEVNFAQYGWNEFYEEYPELAYKRTMNYVEVPFLSHVAFGKKRVQFFLHAGPQIAFFLNEKEKKGGSWEDFSPQPTQHSVHEVQRFNYGITGGGGIEWATRSGRFSLEARYYYALADFFGNKKTDPFARSSHNVTTLRLGWLFDLKK